MAAAVLLSAAGAVALAAGAAPTARAADLLVLEGGADAARFRWTDLPGGARCLAWAGGALVLEPGCSPREYGRDGLLLDCGEIVAVGPDGERALQEGKWTLEEPLVLAAPGLRFWAARGQVELGDRRLLYRDRGEAAKDGRRSLVLLAGIALVTFTLLARARKRLRVS